MPIVNEVSFLREIVIKYVNLNTEYHLTRL